MIYTEVQIEPNYKARFIARDDQSDAEFIARCDLYYYGDDLVGIFNVWTDPQYRQRKLAETLLRQALQAARSMDYEIAFLNVANGQRNVAAERLYTKLGFRYTEPPQMSCPRMELAL